MMAKLLRMIVAITMASVIGCGGAEGVGPIALRDSVPGLGRADTGPPTDRIQALDKQAPVPVPEGTRVFSAGNSKECPVIKVRSFQGETLKLQPGKAGYVTLVVFWSMEWPAAKAVARYVSDLQRRYAQFGVRAVGILLNTPNVKLAHQFARWQQIRYPFYLDDLSALKKMAGKVGADDKRAMPAVFIVDRRLRLRFYRPGFAFTILEEGRKDDRKGTRERVDPRKKTVEEAVPDGQRIEDYLKMLLDEG